MFKAIRQTAGLQGIVASLMVAVAGGASGASDVVFAVSGYEIHGNTLLPEAIAQQAVAPHTGPQSSFETIQAAQKSLQQAYQDAGYDSVRVTLPEQEVKSGTIRFDVIEARLGKVEVRGPQHFSEDNIRASLPGLRMGAVPRLDDYAASLRVANENAAKQTAVVFRQGERRDEIDATIKVADEAPLKLGLSLDNTGTRETGEARLGVLVQHANVLGRDHMLSAQAISSPGHFSDVKIFGLGYRIPLYGWGDSVDLAYGYSNVNSGTVTTAGGVFGISGSGHFASAKYNIYLPRLALWEQKLSFGIDYRSFSNDVRPDGSRQSLVPDAAVHPVSITYSGLLRTEQSDLSAYLTYAHNIPGGENGSTGDFTRPGGRAGATAKYDLWRVGANGGLRLPAGWMVRSDVSAQYTNDLLIVGEQFGIGGAATVRGFDERAVGDDKGYRGSVELYTPNLLPGQHYRVQALGFYDAGRLLRNDPLPGEVAREGIGSTGIGLRAGIGNNLSLKVDYAIVRDGAGETRAGDSKVHASLLIVY